MKCMHRDRIDAFISGEWSRTSYSWEFVEDETEGGIHH